MGFFKQLKSWCSEDTGGRYVSLVLSELFNVSESHKLVSELFGKSIDYATVATEFTFMEGRRADLAFLDEEDNPVAIIEVKYHDHKNERNHAQIADYLKFCGKRKIPFLVITKNRLPDNDEKQIKKHKFASIVSYSQLVHKMSKYNSKDSSAISKLVQSYFEEESLMFAKICKADLQLLLISALHVHNRHGLGRQLSRERIVKAADALRGLIENVTLLGDEIHYSYMDNVFPKRPSAGFYFSPEFSKKVESKVMKDLEEDLEGDSKERYYSISDERIRDGRLVVWYGYTVNNSPSSGFFWLGIGIIAELHTSCKSSPLTTSLFAELTPYIPGVEDQWKPETIKINNIEKISEDEAMSLTQKVFRNVLKKALRGTLPRVIRQKLHNVYKKAKCL